MNKYIKIAIISSPLIFHNCVAAGQVPVKIIGLLLIAGGCFVIWYAHLLGKDSRKMFKSLESEYQSEKIAGQTRRAIGYVMFYLMAAILILFGIF